jgi:hypothetical protein
METWMYWITAVVFTGLGYYLSIARAREQMVRITIENLIANNYLKTKGFGDNQEIVKWPDGCTND